MIDGVPGTELVRRVISGDSTALATLYRGMYEPLWRLALLLSHSADTAQEIVQDVFLNFWTKRETLDIRSDIRVYLYAAVRHRASNIREHDRLVTTTEDAVERHTLDAPAIGMPSPSPDAAAERAEFYTAYREALAVLTERDRVAALLRWEEGMTFEQIAEVLGLSVVGARAVVLRAQQKVRDGLAKYRAG